MKAGEVLRLVQAGGRYLVATRSRHRQPEHAHKPGRANIPGKRNASLAPGTLNSRLKQAAPK
jgi:predicted RNA binding protein YcfA (HicA-like mRNA interferase family)